MNLGIDAFTYITGIVGLLAFLLQVLDKFPEHRELRKTFFLVILGVFVGSTIATLRSSTFNFGSSLSPFEILVGILLALLVFISVTAAFASDSRRRHELFMFAGGGAALLLILFIGKGLSSVDGPDETERKKITFEELIQLAETASSRGSYERALTLLEQASSRLPDSDPRRKAIDKREVDIKQKQLGE